MRASSTSTRRLSSNRRLAISYEIYSNNWPRLKAKLDKMIRRAAKLGVAPLTYEIIDTREVKEGTSTDPKLREEKWYKIYTVELVGESPQIAGWTFYATIQHAGEAGNVIRCSPDAPEGIADKFREAESKCDHCKTNRFRRDTFLVYHEKKGELKQVGSSCIKDFLGHGDPHAVAKYLELLAGATQLLRFGGEGGHGEGGWFAYDLEDFLVRVSANIQKFGWTSRTKAREEGGLATADQVLNVLERVGEWELWDAEVHEANYTEASEALEWAVNLNPKPEEDYLWNIHVVSKSPYMEPRSVGLAASIVASYRRKLAREKAQAERLARGPGRHIGKEKERLEVLVEVMDARDMESYWGATTLYKFETLDKERNTLAWFASGGLVRLSDGTYLDKGAKVKIRGTVKKLQEYQGRFETLMTRVKVLETNPETSEDIAEGTADFFRDEGIPVRSDFDSDEEYEAARKEAGL